MLLCLHAHQKQGFLTSYGALQNTLHELVLSVIVRVRSGSELLSSIRLSLQAQALLLMALSLRSDKPCRQSSIRSTSSWFLGRRGLNLTALSKIKKGHPDRLQTACLPYDIINAFENVDEVSEFQTCSQNGGWFFLALPLI